MKVKPGDTITIDGVVYKFGEGSSEAFNVWNELLDEREDDKGITIDLYTEDGKSGGLFSPSKIKEALEKADFNKTRHGL